MKRVHETLAVGLALAIWFMCAGVYMGSVEFAVYSFWVGAALSGAFIAATVIRTLGGDL